MNENIENINDLQITTGFLYIKVNTMHFFYYSISPKILFNSNKILWIYFSHVGMLVLKTKDNFLLARTTFWS